MVTSLKFSETILLIKIPFQIIHIWTLKEDQEGKIWIGTKNGYLNCYDPVHDKFTCWEIKSDITKENSITAIYHDNKPFVWIGTYRSGVYRLNTKTGEIDHWHNKANDSTTICNNYITTIVKDNYGNFWIGTFNGLCKLSFYNSNYHIKRFYKQEHNPKSLSDNLLWAITQSTTDRNKYFIGTANNLTVLEANKEIFTRINIPNPKNLNFGNGTGVVLEEIINGDQILWINSYAGLLRYNVTQNRFDRFLPDKDIPNSIASNQVNKIFKDHSDVLWIATNNGLSYFTQKNNKFNSSFSNLPFDFSLTNLNEQNTTAFLKSNNNHLWIGTDNGLYHSDYLKGQIQFQKHPKFSNENIWSLASDKDDNLWIGTYGSGLFFLNTKTNQVIPKNVIHKIIASSSRNFIKSLLVDDKNNLWIGYWGIGLSK